MSYRDTLKSTKKWIGGFEYENDWTFLAEAVPGMSTILLEIKGDIPADDLPRVIALLQQVHKEAKAYHRKLYGSDA